VSRALACRLVSWVACWLACWGCGAAPSPGVELLHRADDRAAQLEDQLLIPYRARHPGLQVVQHNAALAQAEYRRLLLTATAGDALPDVFQLDDSDVPAVADRGGALDLTPYLSRVGVDLARYNPEVLAIFRRGAALYGLPRGYTPLMVVYNRDLLDRAAIAYPTDDWTWDEFLRTAQLLTRDRDGDGRIDQWGAAFDRRPSLWLPWVWAGGGDVLCPGGRRASGCLDAAATVEAMRWYGGWVTRWGIAPRPHDPRSSGVEIARLFAAGRVAFMTVGHDAVRALRASVAAGRLRVGFAPIPHRAGVPPATVLYATGYAVPARALRRKAGVELAADLTDSLPGGARGEAGIELPAVTAAAQEVAAADTLGWEAAFLRAAAHGRPGWGARVAQWREVEAELADLMDRVTVGGANPARAARATARELDRLLGATR
jgi:multiple sugar transport system substrate-binding protein